MLPPMLPPSLPACATKLSAAARLGIASRKHAETVTMHLTFDGGRMACSVQSLGGHGHTMPW